MRHHFVRSSAGLRDPNFKNVTLLLHGDGTNGGQNNTFLDSSGSNNAITRTGNVAQGSFSPYGDRWSNYFDGTGDDLTLTGQNLSATDWTVECWVYFQSFSNNAPHLWNFGTDINNRFNVWRNSTTGTFSFTRVNGGTYDIKNGTTSPVIGRWYHVAVVRVNSTGVHTLYIDGIPEVTNTGSITSGTTWTIGFVPTGGLNDRMLGYISNLRVVTSAIYTTNFTPPTVPLAAIPNTSLLTCSTNRFRDASSNNRTITRNGDVSVQRFSPFGPDTLYRTDRIAGSAYFDGNDYLQIANRPLKFSAGFFTAECWVYISAYPASLAALFNDHYWQGGQNGGYIVYIVNTGQVRIEASSGNFNNWGGTVITSSNSLIRGQWNHLAIVRGANNLVNIYINGVSTTTPVARTSFELNTGVAQASWQSKIGLQVNDANLWYGFTGIISDLRVINGKCLYTANFTPPTEPLTAIPETTFLGRFANASIVDNAMMNNWETVGSAQISTSIKKYGAGSIYNPAGSSLRVNSIAPNAFGTGDFTVEFWLYPLGTQFGTPISNWTGPGNWAFLFEGQQITFSGPAAGYQVFVKDPTNITLNQWTHIAVSRASGTMRLFRNGIVVASAANSTSFTAAGQLSIGSLYGDGTSWQFNGYYDDIRITSGVARYTSDFAPPTAPLPDF